ncbi:hypothetical protein BDN72DRAFT_906119 [Pluteus cervinus]|uniref:Uncharacterized protein n=1 Tax=Pluteus cervinus TaxID=181527 RepID=A0ACD3A0Q6_9AGAR|nr:hypothetical protein BDN72DRAFT_906119 [Pluteus cervinus]
MPTSLPHVVSRSPTPELPLKTRITLPGAPTWEVPRAVDIIHHFSQKEHNIGNPSFPDTHVWVPGDVNRLISTSSPRPEDEYDVDNVDHFTIVGRVRPYDLYLQPLGTYADLDYFEEDYTHASYRVTIGAHDGEAYDGYFARVMENILKMENRIKKPTTLEANTRRFTSADANDQTVKLSARVFCSESNPRQSTDLPITYPDGSRVPTHAIPFVLPSALVEGRFVFVHAARVDRSETFKAHLKGVRILALYV